MKGRVGEIMDPLWCRTDCIKAAPDALTEREVTGIPDRKIQCTGLTHVWQDAKAR